MKRPNLILCALIGMVILWSSCENETIQNSQENATNEDAQSTDIGCVVYVKNPDQSGNLIANWAYSTSDTSTLVGTGYTTKSPESQDFKGNYKIYYTGAFTDSFDLIISENNSSNSEIFYPVEWHDITTGVLEYYGTGIVKDSQLIVGWRQ